MSADCQRCPHLEMKLALLSGDVRTVTMQIRRELEDKATMSRSELLGVVQQRLEFALADTAGGR